MKIFVAILAALLISGVSAKIMSQNIYEGSYCQGEKIAVVSYNATDAQCSAITDACFPYSTQMFSSSTFSARFSCKEEMASHPFGPVFGTFVGESCSLNNIQTATYLKSDYCVRGSSNTVGVKYSCNSTDFVKYECDDGCNTCTVAALSQFVTGAREYCAPANGLATWVGCLEVNSAVSMTVSVIFIGFAILINILL